MKSADFEGKLAVTAKAVGAFLDDILQSHQLVAGTPQKLLGAMRHGVLNGGKRLRPFLVIETAKMFSGDSKAAMQVGAALECVHSYSLVHDDLPAMDDDDLRRGKPTVHKAFDEATAILAGDALLTLSFGLIASCDKIPAEARAALVVLLAKRGGAPGMVGGQMLDIQAGDSRSEIEITRMQAMKTGALISCSCEAGALLSGACDDDRARLRRFGDTIGLAFQLADDLLDEYGEAEVVGKATGKDQAKGKRTLGQIYGRRALQDRLDALESTAEELLEPYGERAELLLEAARFVVWRKH
ncbi:polyprenyl synthetase family protein [Aurantimonas sp. VKM B-3413]|uniref:polyprenyl synthetase family protein n=1 Tax=Aurantimonas sp. VKM B-3413 TaxID=2779401 RepID=UPI001E47138F|nr:farnesyl diphosphate synthase [Aurantimonas sp. VKM B-3413]MCB8839067.1 polyprenyl synthetase family protein [Aurantimonas sp. VKM B-3413]